MKGWEAPVTDRTQTDVLKKTEKGFLKFSDLDRIENNLGFLADETGRRFVPKNWDNRPLLYISDLDRILSMLRAVKSEFSYLQRIPEIPDQPINVYSKVNDIEMIELLIKNAIVERSDAATYCGESFAGEGERGLI